jgi:hypothetical protein
LNGEHSTADSFFAILRRHVGIVPEHPIGAVRSLSMERIVLDRQREAIPESWRQRPELGEAQ